MNISLNTIRPHVFGSFDRRCLACGITLEEVLDRRGLAECPNEINSQAACNMRRLIYGDVAGHA